jgi:multiple antibiotic resistance protein
MTRGIKAEQSEPRVQTPDSAQWGDLAMVPLLFPLSIGGGTIAVAVSESGRHQSIEGLLLVSTVVLAMVPVVVMTFLAAGSLRGRLSTGALDALARVSGIVLVALAVQLLAQGLTELILASPLAAALGAHAPIKVR